MFVHANQNVDDTEADLVITQGKIDLLIILILFICFQCCRLIRFRRSSGRSVQPSQRSMDSGYPQAEGLFHSYSDPDCR